MDKRPLFNKAFAVGLLAAVCGAAFMVAFTFFRKGGYSDRDSYRVHAYFEDATGLTWKSRVQIAGIQVGEVDRIVLMGARARLDLRIRKDIDLRADGCLTKRFPSALLPDALLDLVPGTLRSPSLRDLPEEQRELTCVSEGTTVAKLLDSMSKIANDVQGVTRELSEMVAGNQGSIRQIIANLERTSRTINQNVEEGQDKVQAILDNTRQLTSTLNAVTAADRERYHAIAENLASATQRLDAVLKSVQGMVGDGGEGGDIKKSVAEARQAIERLNNTMGQVEKVTQQVAEGKSIAGKLLTDERLGQKFGDTVETVSDYVDKLNKIQIKVGFRSEWLLNQTGAKTYASFSIVPRPDKYYLFEIVNDPRGITTQQVATVNTQTPTGTVTTVTTTYLNEQKLAFSLQFAKRYGPATFRIGLIESSGGVGADLHLLDDALKVSLNLYQFDRVGQQRPDYPRAKFWLDYNFLKYFYVTAGTDDFLNAWQQGHWPGGPKFSVGEDVFFGAGVSFTDDDLKTLLGVTGGGGAVSGAATTSR